MAEAPPKEVVTVYKVPFNKAQLEAFTKEERALIVLLGNAANQLTVFWKLVYFSTNDAAGQDVGRAHALVQGGQTQILVRQTVGIAFEAWELIRTRYLQTLVGREFQARLSPAGLKALENLKKYFSGKGNLIYTIRNHFAFHHPESVDVESDFQAAMGDKDLDEEWNWYLTALSINTFYFLSDLVISQGMARVAGFKDIADGHRRVMENLNPVFSWVGEFVQAFFYAVMAKYHSELPAEVVANIDGTVADAVSLPYYIVEGAPKPSAPEIPRA